MLSIVIPIFNEEQNIRQLCARLVDSGKCWDDIYEVVLVNYGSTDNSLALMQETAVRDERFMVVSLSRNFGHQAAISAGLKLATGDAIIVMDGDLQDPPEQLVRFIEKWRQGYDVIYAVRTKRKEGWLKRLAYASFYRIMRVLTQIDLPLDAGDFCIMDRKVVNVLVGLPEKSQFMRGLRAFSGFRQTGIPYERAARAAGTAKYTLPKLIKLAMDGIFDFSIVPLRVATFLGFAMAIPSFLTGMFFIVHRVIGFRLFGHTATETPGLATLAVGIFFLSGIILISLGIIGEYLGRMYLEVKNRPGYIIENIFPPRTSRQGHNGSSRYYQCNNNGILEVKFSESKDSSLQ